MSAGFWYAIVRLLASGYAAAISLSLSAYKNVLSSGTFPSLKTLTAIVVTNMLHKIITSPTHHQRRGYT
uniref:Putative secreted peptide n=1 Tax=Anopheles braziliensis TaxID=58242 RepID=A0A2M3ZTG7_9DIPT